MITREQLERYLETGDLTGVTLFINGQDQTVSHYDGDWTFFTNGNKRTSLRVSVYFAEALARQLLETMKP